MSSSPAGDKRLMTEDTPETKDVDSTDCGTKPDRQRQSTASPDRANSRSAPTYVVRLRRDLQMTDVTQLLRYISDFGSAAARGHALDGGWCIRLSNLSDLRLSPSNAPN
jgi:hypothetical protein